MREDGKTEAWWHKLLDDFDLWAFNNPGKALLIEVILDLIAITCIAVNIAIGTR